MSGNTAKKLEPPMRYDTGGRPSVDWEELFVTWLDSGIHKRKFLAQYGLNFKSSNVKKKTRGWNSRNRDSIVKAVQSHNVEVIETNRMHSIYQMVMQWRAGLAEIDYTTCRRIRDLVIKRIDKLEEKDAVYDSLELRRLASAVAEIQRVQRLALGMSTENVGVDFPEVGDSNVDNTPDDTQAPQCPVFVVEVNDNGKFRRARPKQIA
jgi:hypothetical protein